MHVTSYTKTTGSFVYTMTLETFFWENSWRFNVATHTMNTMTFNGSFNTLVWNRPFSQFSDLNDLHRGSCHTAYRRVSLINIWLHTKFCWNCKNFLWTNWRTQIETSFIRSTRRNWPENEDCKHYKQKLIKTHQLLNTDPVCIGVLIWIQQTFSTNFIDHRRNYF